RSTALGARPPDMSTEALDGGFSGTFKEYVKKTKLKKGTLKGKGDYWKWFTKYGHNVFKDMYNEEYMGDDRPDHRQYITALWNEARDTQGGWEVWGKHRGGTRVPKVERGPWTPLRPILTEGYGMKNDPDWMEEPPIRRRRARFMRHTKNEMDIRMQRTFNYLTAKLKIVMGGRESNRGEKSGDDVLRDLRSFVLIVHEYTSNAKGDRVAPAEVTLLTFSLSRGMQKVLSKVIKYHQTLVTTSENLQEQEYSRILESYEKNGIAAERFINGASDPKGIDVISIERLKSDLLAQLSDSNNKYAPIMFLKDNYNEAAGMLFTLFPDYWEHLENRFCFIEDMFRIYTKVQTNGCFVHPIRDYRHLPTVPLCSFHENLGKKTRQKRDCTFHKAVLELQCIFKDLHDGKVLDMGRLYDPGRHQNCSEDTWDQDGPQIDWSNVERTEERRREPVEASPLDRILSSDEDTDDSLDLPVTRADSPYGGGSYGGQQQRGNGYGDRREASQTSSNDRYEGRGYGSGREEKGGYGRNDYGGKEKENWKRGAGNGFSNSNNGRGGGSGYSNENGGRREYDTAPRLGQPDHSGYYN
ncbi:hypothetical protein PENTCL1PPCAC_7330, partial [Pristionchus entomophagus]